jgi:hypothetical protein
MTSYHKILFTLIISATCLFLADKIISRGARKFNVHSYQKMEEIFENDTYYHIVFIGSSRTHTSIVPSVIDSITGYSTFNAGMDGAGFAEFKMIFEGYLLKHPAPKKIVLTLDVDSFDDIYKFFNYNLYLRFIKNKVVDTTLTGNGYGTFYYKLFPFLRPMEMNDFEKRNAIAGFSGENEFFGEAFDNKGYISNGDKCIYTLDAVYDYEKYQINEKAVSMLNSIVQKCKEKQIELIFTYAPEYNYRLQKYALNFNEVISTIDSIAAENHLTFFRDDRLDMCREKCFFANYGHLNIAGANEYSVLLGRRLKDGILQNP